MSGSNMQVQAISEVRSHACFCVWVIPGLNTTAANHSRCGEIQTLSTKVHTKMFWPGNMPRFSLRWKTVNLNECKT